MAKRRIKKIGVGLTSNWGLKLSALALACALWLLARGGEGERVFMVPLAVQVPRNMEIVNERPSSVQVTVAGATNIIGPLPEMSYTIDLHAADEGDHTVQLNAGGVRVTRGADVRILRVSPAWVKISLERVISKQIPVKVQVVGNPPEGIDVYQVTQEPKSVLITGRRSQVTPVTEAATEPVSLNNRKQTFQTKVNFRLENDDIHADPADVVVTFELGVRRVEQTVTVPLSLADPAAYTANPPAVAVSVLVPVTLKRELVPEDLKAYVMVPAGEADASRVIAKPEVELAAPLDLGISIKQVRPEKVTLLRRSRKK